MSIDGINFNKIPKKTNINQQNNETNNGPSVAPEMSEAEKTAMAKMRDTILSRYFLATLALGGGMATGLTSCGDVTQNQEVDIDQSAILNKLDQLISLNKAMLEQLQQQSDLLVQNNSDNAELKKLIQDLITQNKQITSIINGISGDVSDIKAANIRIVALLEEANANDVEFLAKLDKIINGQADEASKLNQILQANQEQNNTLINIQKLLETANESDEKLGDILNKFYNDYKEGDATKSEMIKNIINEIKNNSNISQDILDAINDFSKKWQAGSITDSELLGQITDLLGKIENNTAGILEAVTKISGQIAELDAKLDASQGAVLDGIKDAIEGIGGKLDKVIANQEKGNETLIEISDKIDKVNANISQIGDKILTKQDVQELLGDLYNKLADKITGSQFTAGDLEAILDKYKTDLTRTNALIETLVNLVANLDVDGGNSEALKAIEDAINAFKNQSAGNAEAVQGKLQDVLDALAGQQGSLDALVKIGNSVLANQDKAMTSATTYGTKLMDELSKIGSTMINQESFKVYADSYTEYLQKAEQQRQEQYAVLSAILQNMGQGKGVDVDELIAKLPNYTDILNEISDKLGKVITSSDLEQFFIKTKPDLTRTNALIETLVNLVANLDVSGSGSGSSMDLTDIKSLVSEIRTLIKNQQVPSTSQMQELIDSVKSLSSSSTPSAQSRATGGVYYHQGWSYN